MERFDYTGTDSTGQVHGTLDAKDEASARAELTARGITVTNIKKELKITPPPQPTTKPPGIILPPRPTAGSVSTAAPAATIPVATATGTPATPPATPAPATRTPRAPRRQASTPPPVAPAPTPSATTPAATTAQQTQQQGRSWLPVIVVVVCIIGLYFFTKEGGRPMIVTSPVPIPQKVQVETPAPIIAQPVPTPARPVMVDSVLNILDLPEEDGRRVKRVEKGDRITFAVPATAIPLPLIEADPSEFVLDYNTGQFNSPLWVPMDQFRNGQQAVALRVQSKTGRAFRVLFTLVPK